MCVIVGYKGRFGNHMFQYTAGRLLAEAEKLQMRYVLPANLILACKGGEVTSAPCNKAKIVKVNDANWPSRILADVTACYHFDGWFQVADRYCPQREKIARWFECPDAADGAITEDDVVMHVRLGDYLTNWQDGSRVIHPQWYLDILAKETYRNLYIVTGTYDEKYLSHFKALNPILLCGTPAYDFHFMRKFRRMVMSNSTFAWWAYFLGRGKQCWTFKPWVKDPQVQLAKFDGATEVDGEFFTWKQ